MWQWLEEALIAWFAWREWGKDKEKRDENEKKNQNLKNKGEYASCQK